MRRPRITVPLVALAAVGALPAAGAVPAAVAGTLPGGTSAIVFLAGSILLVRARDLP